VKLSETLLETFAEISRRFQIPDVFGTLPTGNFLRKTRQKIKNMLTEK